MRFDFDARKSVQLKKTRSAGSGSKRCRMFFCGLITRTNDPMYRSNFVQSAGSDSDSTL